MKGVDETLCVQYVKRRALAILFVFSSTWSVLIAISYR